MRALGPKRASASVPGWIVVAIVMMAVVAIATYTAALAQSKRGIALVIGNGAYQHAAGLANPKSDAVLMSGVLRQRGFDVIEGIDLDKRSLELKIREFSRAVSKAKVAVFFYAGHGLQVAGQNYLVPVDARLEEADALDFEAIKIEVVQRIMESSERTSLIFLDACRDNPLARNLARALGTRSANIGKGLANIESGAGTLISFSTQPGSVALDGDGANSPYSKALAREIVKPGEDLSSALIAVRNSVMDETRNKQVPWEHSAMRAKFFFGDAPSAGSAGTAATQPTSEAERLWTQIQTSQSRAVLDSFARQFPNTVYAALANERSEVLKRQEAGRTASTAPLPAVLPSSNTSPEVLPKTEGPASSPTRSAIKVGVAGPLTGPNEVFGQQLKNGAERAAADINAKGGINGQPIELLYVDDAGDPKQGVAVANRLVSAGVKFVVGHFNSGVSIPASQIYAENNVLMVTPSSSHPRLTESGLWNVFRTCSRDDQQGGVAGDYVAAKFKGKKLAIVHDKTTFGKSMADQMQLAANAKGVKEVIYEGVNVGEKDFSALVSKIKAAGVEIVYWGGLATESGLIARQLREQGVRVTMIAGDGIASDEFAAIGGPAVEGVLMTFPPDPRRRPEAAAVVKAFEAKKFNPEGYTLYAYAALEIVAQAANEGRSSEPKQIAETLRTGRTWPTVIGGLAFNKKGDITRPDYVMYTWKKNAAGRFTYVEN